MLNPRDERELEALHALREDGDWRVVRKYLEEEVSRLRRRLVIAETDQEVRRLQGAAHVIQELLDMQDGAFSALKKRRKS